MHLWQVAANNQYTLIKQPSNNRAYGKILILKLFLKLSVICSDLFMQTYIYTVTDRHAVIHSYNIKGFRDNRYIL